MLNFREFLAIFIMLIAILVLVNIRFYDNMINCMAKDSKVVGITKVTKGRMTK